MGGGLALCAAAFAEYSKAAQQHLAEDFLERKNVPHLISFQLWVNY